MNYEDCNIFKKLNIKLDSIESIVTLINKLI